jgi:DNA repair exonuclease SbcCD ATPase subunit
MDLQYFDVLEEKINKIVLQTDNLKTENRELRMRIQELQAVLEEKERVIYALKAEVDKSRNVQGEIETYKKNQDRIRVKVETLLEKLKEFETT